MRVVALEEHFTIPDLVRRIPPAAIRARGFPPPDAPWGPASQTNKLRELGEPRLREMDEGGITTQVLSVAGPGADLLPPEIVWRTKSQFDEGTGVGDLVDRTLADHWSQAGVRPLEAVLASVAEPEMVAHVAAVAGRWTAGRLGEVA